MFPFDIGNHGYLFLLAYPVNGVGELLGDYDFVVIVIYYSNS